MTSFDSALLDHTPLTKNGESYRSRSPGETVQHLLPHLSELGITRIANITGLDRIGIPVWIAVRPNSRSLSLSQGKGTTHDCARASALCESIETFYAERCVNPIRIARYAALRREANVADVEQLPLSRRALYDHREPLPWVEATDLLGGQSVWVPYELVHADATVPRYPGSGCFVFSTNGLASGNTVAEAVLHGLCELIERDAMALWKLQGRNFQRSTRVDLSSVSDPVCVSLIRRLEECEILPLVWDVTSDIGVPVTRVLFFDRWAHSHLAAQPVAFGAGCHPEPTVALVRALTEAAQSRLTAISGSRDDFTRQMYRDYSLSPADLDEYSRLAADPGEREWGSVRGNNMGSIGNGIAWVLEQLERKDIRQVCAVELSPQGAPLHVVRTLAPGLEGPSSSATWRPGERARRIAG